MRIFLTAFASLGLLFSVALAQNNTGSAPPNPTTAGENQPDYQYDSQDRQVRTQDDQAPPPKYDEPAGPTIELPKVEFKYDADGRLIFRPDPDGGQVRGPGGSTSQFEYDGYDRLEQDSGSADPDISDSSVDPLNNPELFKQCPDCTKQADAVDKQQAALDNLAKARGTLTAQVAASAATHAAAQASAQATQTALDNFNNPRSSASSGEVSRDSSDLASQRFASGNAWDSYQNGDMTAQELEDFWQNFDEADLAKARADLKAKLEADNAAANKAAKDAKSKLDAQTKALGKLDQSIADAKAQLNKLKKALQDCLDKCKKGEKKGWLDSFFDIFADLGPLDASQLLTEAEKATQFPPIPIPIPDGPRLDLPEGDFQVDSFFDVFGEIDLPDDPKALGPQQIQDIEQHINPPRLPAGDFPADSFFDVFFAVEPQDEPREVPIELVELGLQSVDPINVGGGIDSGNNLNWFFGPPPSPEPEFDLTLPPSLDAWGKDPVMGPPVCPRCQGLMDELNKKQAEAPALQGALRLLQAKIAKLDAAINKSNQRVKSLEDALDRMENPSSWAESEGRRTDSADLEARRQAMADAWGKYRTGQLTAQQLENYWENFEDAQRDAWKQKIKDDLKKDIKAAKKVAKDLKDQKTKAQKSLAAAQKKLKESEDKIVQLETDLAECLKKCEQGDTTIGFFEGIGDWFGGLMADPPLVGGPTVEEIIEDTVENTVTPVVLLPPSGDNIAPTDPATNDARGLIVENTRMVRNEDGTIDIIVDIPSDTSRYNNLKFAVAPEAGGNLVVSNIGSSGQDGVRIDLGDNLGSSGEDGVKAEDNLGSSGEDGLAEPLEVVEFDLPVEDDTPESPKLEIIGGGVELKLDFPPLRDGTGFILTDPETEVGGLFMPAASVQRDADGNLVISNIGSSGQDGVQIDLDNSSLGQDLINPNPTVRDFATGGGVFDPRGGLNGFDLPVVGLSPGGGVADPHGNLVQVHPDGTFTFTPNLEIVPDGPPAVEILPPDDGGPVFEGGRVDIKLEVTDDGLLQPVKLDTDPGLFNNETPRLNEPFQLIVPDGWSAPNGVPAQPPIGFDPILDLNSGLGGGGTFDINPDGQLVISNIGSSGQDGVSQIMSPTINEVQPDPTGAGGDGEFVELGGSPGTSATPADWYTLAEMLTGETFLDKAPLPPSNWQYQGRNGSSDSTTTQDETSLPEEADAVLGFDADPFLKYVGNFLNSGATSPTADLSTTDPAIVDRMFADAATAYRGRVRTGFGTSSPQTTTGGALFPDIDLSLPGGGAPTSQVQDPPTETQTPPTRRVIIIIIIKKKNVAPPTFPGGVTLDSPIFTDNLGPGGPPPLPGDPLDGGLLLPGNDSDLLSPGGNDRLNPGEVGPDGGGLFDSGGDDLLTPPPTESCGITQYTSSDCGGGCNQGYRCTAQNQLSDGTQCYDCEFRCNSGEWANNTCSGTCAEGIQRCVPTTVGNSCFKCITVPTDIIGSSPSEKNIVPSPPTEPIETCTPSCSGKQCGADGCGGSCGDCDSHQSCNAIGLCIDDKPDFISCNPDFYELDGECLSCPAGCTAPLGSVGADSCECPAPKPQCVPECSGKQCGADGCGGICGQCDSGSSCSGGECVSDGPSCSAGSTPDESLCNSQCSNGLCNDGGGSGCFTCLQCDSGSFSTQSTCEAGGDTCEIGGSQSNLSCWVPVASCADLCTQNGFSAEPIDFTSQVEAQLNAQTCVSSYSMTIQQASVGDCQCYVTDPPQITFDTTPPVCAGTVCGDVQCNNSATCATGENQTSTVTCNWGGWQKQDLYQYIPLLGGN